MDQWVQKLSMAIILVSAGVAFYARGQGVDCWCPAHFTYSHVKYTDTICASKNATHYLTEDTEIAPVVLLTKDSTPLRYLAGEFLLAVGLFSLIKCLLTSNSLDGLYKDARYYRKIPMYVLFQVIGSFIWGFFAILTHNMYTQLEEREEPFYCEFQITQLGQIHPYVVQCVENGTELLNATFMCNIGLCVVVVLSKLIHLVSIFVVQPFFRVNKTVSKDVDNEIHEIGIKFWMSDQYFDLLAHSPDVTPLLKPNEYRKM